MVKEGAKVLVGSLVFLGIVAVIGAVIWGFGVLTAPIKGKGDAAKINYSAENWTQKQAMFQHSYNGIIGFDKEITRYKEAIASGDDDRMNKELLNGVTAACNAEVTKYNAESNVYLSQDWKSINLPSQIDNTDPLTDCK